MDEKILGKIQKLLALAAGDPDSPEAKLAAQRAGEIMAKHDIGIEDVDEFGNMSKDGIIEETVVARNKHHQAWESMLGNVLCECFDCKKYVSSKIGTRTFVGAKSDVAMLVWFYKYLRLRIAKQAEHEWSLQRDQKEFGLGAVHGLSPRLQDMYKKKEEVTLSDSRALVISKQLAVTDYFDTKYKGLKKKGYTHSGGNRNARVSGVLAGQSMGINKQVT